MSFTTTVDVPPAYNWNNLLASFNPLLMRQRQTNPTPEIQNMFAWLLRTASWKRGIDWNVIDGQLTLELPFDGPMANTDTLRDHHDWNTGVNSDSISFILSEILAQVPVDRVLSHFVRVER